MAQRPTLGQPGWGADLNDYLDVSLDTDGTLKPEAIESAIGLGAEAATDIALTKTAIGYTTQTEKLDIWEPFDRSNAVTSWVDDTYINWIAGLDAYFAAELGNGTVTREVLGQDAADNDIISYTHGDAGKITVLVVAGLHGERIMQRSTMRFFEGFVRSDHPIMRRLRSIYRLVWLVTATPTAFPTNRDNANGVDINRNFGFWWDRYTEDDATPKGSAAFGEPESQIVRDLIDDVRPTIVMDCHSYAGSPGEAEMVIGRPSSYTLGAKQFASDVLAAYGAVYNRDNTLTLELANDVVRHPVCRNWASYAMRWQHGNTQSAAILIDGAYTAGSTHLVTTRPSIQAYAGMMTTVLTTWLEAGGHIATPPYPYAMALRREGQSSPTSITAGGTRLDAGTNTPIAFTFPVAVPIGTDPQDYMEVPIAYAPAFVEVEASGQIYTNSPAPTAGRIEVAIHQEGDSNVALYSSELVHFPNAANTSVSFSTSAQVRIDAVSVETPPTFSLVFTVLSGGGGQLTVRRCRMTARVFPHTAEAMAFRVS